MSNPIDIEAQLAELRLYLDTLVEILIGREHLAEGNRKHLQTIRKRAGLTSTTVKLASGDKYAVANSDVDCASLISLCKARCCSFNVTLTTQDLEEGELRWDWDKPYIMKHDADGYCSNMDRETAQCSCYEVRPGACRSYDCRQDLRVWKDFDARIPAPLADGLIPPESLSRKS